MNIKKNDTVKVITGKYKNVEGRVTATDPKNNTVTVENVNKQKRHEKARRAQEQSKIVEVEGPIDASNVMVVCPTCHKAIRVKKTELEVDGKKKNVRICPNCFKNGETVVLDKAFKKEAEAQTAAAPKRQRKRAKAEKTETTEE